MAQIDHALSEFRQMDELAAGRSPLHQRHPAVKLLVTIAYILLVVSFPKYDLAELIVMALYPLAMFEWSGVSIRTCFHKLRVVLPLVCAVGLFNPFLDRAPLLSVGGVLVSGGVISMLTLMLKGVFSLMASFLLAATTPIDSLCAALRRLHVPSLLVTLLLLTYRYIALMIEETSIMSDAYKLRAPGQKGIHVSAWGSFLGQLLLRSMDRAEELYAGMQLRGFEGDFPYADAARLKRADVLFFVICIAAFVLCRVFPVIALLGQLFV